MGEAIRRFLINALKDLANVAWKTTWGMFGGAMSLIKGAFKGVLSYHQEGISFARQMGMSFKQSQAYTNVLIDRASKLGEKYGITADKVFELQRNLSAATGRQLMLNNAQAEAQVRINKLVDTATSNRFTEEIITHMGGQIQSVQGAISKAYATAAKSGLDASRFSEKVAQNLQLANKLSFKNGIEGITRMTVLSERLGFNLQSVEAAANNFMELDKAIENAAHLQMLGSAASAYGSNPLTMSYEANYDPEAFMTRITNMLQGLATFNTKTGMAEVNGMNKDFVKAIAQAAGMNYEEAMSIAKNQATVQYKENQFGSVLQNPRYTEEMRNFILNTSYVQDGKLMMTDTKGRGKEVSQFSEKELMDKMGFANMSDSEIIASQAQTLTSIQELAQGTWTSMNANIARGVTEQIPAIMGIMRKLSGPLLELSRTLGTSLGAILPELVKTAGNVLTAMEPIVDMATAAIKWFGENSKLTAGILAALLAIKLAMRARRTVKSVQDFFRGKKGRVGKIPRSSGASPRRFSRFGEKVKRGFGATKSKVGNVASRATQPFRDYGKYVKSNYQTLKSQGRGGLRGALQAMRNPRVLANQTLQNRTTGRFLGSMKSNAAKSTFAKNALRGGRLLKGGVASIGLGLGGMATEALLNSGVVDKNSALGETLGVANSVLNSNTAQMAAMGSMLGPWGTAIGGLIGVGMDVKKDYEKWKQQNPEGGFWDYSKDKVGKVADEMKKGWSNVTQVYKDAGGGLKGFLKGAWEFTKEFNVFSSIKKTWKGLTGGNSEPEAHASGGIVGGDSFVGDQILTRVNSGEMILNHGQQAALFDLLNGKAGAQSRIGLPKEPSVSIRPLSVALEKVDGGVRSTLSTRNDVQAKPVGEREYIYVPPKVQAPNGGSVTVNDFNINISGTIKLDAGNSQKSVSTQELLNDRQFVNSLKELIKQSINNDINGGRFMNDVAQMRGLPAQTALWGRK